MKHNGRPGEAFFFAAVYAIVRQIPRESHFLWADCADAWLATGGPNGWLGHAACPDELPWHRVVKADGSIAGGGYAEIRRALLRSEGMPFLPDGRLDMGAAAGKLIDAQDPRG